ncbi:MerR family transcriptional regulator [Streptomyces sp. NPDC006197]|uniref:MerR family transcriptional regulator n=1 Tax=Streptomyces sp. NPDC006197 TaxID=3156685 RepID=UPI0033B8C0C4
MEEDTWLGIGELARRGGVSVKAVRFYSDQGIVRPAGRSAAGYRMYDVDAVARLELVRTLRDLGIGLPAIRRVLDREVSLPEVAAVHAEALDVQIRALRLRRAVLTAVASRGSTPEETELMHKLARLSEEERRRLVDGFLDSVFGGLGAEPVFAGVRRSMTPELPADPEPEQIRAWVELAELCQEPGFRDSVRRAVEYETREWGGGGVPRPGLAAVVGELVGPAVRTGVDPGSPEADPFVRAVVASSPDGPRALLERLDGMVDPRRERYFRLLAVVNGWEAPESPAPAVEWTVRALRARHAPKDRP